MHSKKLIYIGYGVPKSASSFVFQIGQAATRYWAKEHDVPVLDLNDFLPNVELASFPDRYIAEHKHSPGSFDSLEQLIELIDHSLPDTGGAIALKTHLPCCAKLRKRIRNGQIVATASFRHPADSALSLRDMRARENIPLDFNVAASRIQGMSLNLDGWLACAEVLSCYFDDVVTNPLAVEREISKLMDIRPARGTLVNPLLENKETRILQFNKAVLNRRKDELTAEESLQIEQAVPRLIRHIDRRINRFTEHEQKDVAATPSLPEVSVLTVCADTAPRLDETIQSVLSQRGEFRIHHHIQAMRGNSELIRQLERWANWMSPGNDGAALFHASSFSFSLSEPAPEVELLSAGAAEQAGDYRGFLAVGDTLERGAIQTVIDLCASRPEVQWVTGVPAERTDDNLEMPSGQNDQPLRPVFWPRMGICAGQADGRALPVIPASGTFWSEMAWQSSGGELRPEMQQFCEYEFWMRLARQYDLVSIVAPLARRRKREASLVGRDAAPIRKSIMKKHAKLRKEANTVLGASRKQDAWAACCQWPDGDWDLKLVQAAQ